MDLAGSDPLTNDPNEEGGELAGTQGQGQAAWEPGQLNIYLNNNTSYFSEGFFLLIFFFKKKI